MASPTRFEATTLPRALGALVPCVASPSVEKCQIQLAFFCQTLADRSRLPSPSQFELTLETHLNENARIRGRFHLNGVPNEIRTRVFTVKG